MGNWVKLGVGEVIFPREEHANCLSYAKWSSPQTIIQVTLYGLNRSLAICMFTQIHICTQ